MVFLFYCGSRFTHFDVNSIFYSLFYFGTGIVNDSPKSHLSEKELDLWSIINNQVKEEVYYTKGNALNSFFHIFQRDPKK
jgi:hypothetical protein